MKHRLSGLTEIFTEREKFTWPQRNAHAVETKMNMPKKQKFKQPSCIRKLLSLIDARSKTHNIKFDAICQKHQRKGGKSSYIEMSVTENVIFATHGGKTLKCYEVKNQSTININLLTTYYYWENHKAKMNVWPLIFFPSLNRM